MSPAASWALLAGLLVGTFVLIAAINRLDRVLDDALARRRSRRRRVHGFDEEHRYQLAREAVARQLSKSNVQIGRKETGK